MVLPSRASLGGYSLGAPPLRKFNSKQANDGKDGSAMDEPEPKENRRPAIAGLAIAVVLLVVGWWLARELTAASKMQDCLMSGRTNCNVIQPQ
jgi:hypothetical protein